jgi:iron-sulfur cluster assembly protein
MDCNKEIPSSSSNQLIQVTDDARTEIKRLLEAQGQGDFGLRIGILSGGCAGLTYDVRFSKKGEEDIVVDHGDFQIFVNPQDLVYLRGVTVVYQDCLTTRGLKIHNPNAISACGCGESFYENRGEPAPGPSGCCG